MVSVPDHEGLEGMWGTRTSRLPGARRLRATLNFESFGLAADSKVGLWGYSGGGLASAWAAGEVHADYAPELNVVGAVLGSPVGNLGNTFRRLNGTHYAGLPALVVSALAKTYPG